MKNTDKYLSLVSDEKSNWIEDLELSRLVNEKYYKILDRDGIEMPDNWAVTTRTYERVKKLLDRLNVNGECRPYTMVEK